MRSDAGSGIENHDNKFGYVETCLGPMPAAESPKRLRQNHQNNSIAN